MAERKVFDCDSCGKKNVEVKKIELKTGRRMDAAGDIEDIFESMDLCIDCLAKGIMVFFSRNHSISDALAFFNKMKGKDWNLFWRYQ